MLAQLRALQQEYPVAWEQRDMDAVWLGNRLMLFPYILEPQINVTTPRLWSGMVNTAGGIPVFLVYSGETLYF